MHVHLTEKLFYLYYCQKSKNLCQTKIAVLLANPSSAGLESKAETESVSIFEVRRY